ncbi:helix-turn-helix transcriptional regulator [Thermoflavimicrobium daqui]|jgi:predicted ArsR family transcriptional regulator|uniref:ArsR family transcriptional regulator n=1 Tax=Thermoflavimicrobium daqui TaxID=2137476 RepID=A0A364K9V4_9BACL|nr:metalloregulator ArsR/SmtB family transcription factor [Thermoflavimicrobium daqui]RAL27002.1 ArsR family transcriptional regulator [Thermoflavimicrobium daqui]
MRENGSTRNQILILLKTKGPLTVSDMAEHLGVTEMAVRRHLNTLERDQLIQSQLLRQSMGRPTSQYFLTEKSEEFFPKNYHMFTLDLLQDLEELQGSEFIDSLFRNREKRLTESYQSMFQEKSLRERIETLAKLQESKGYMVEWEENSAESFTLVEHNCPIVQIANRYNQACNCELNWFRNLLDAEVQLYECKAKGGQNCVYFIRQKAENQEVIKEAIK